MPDEARTFVVALEASSEHELRALAANADRHLPMPGVAVAAGGRRRCATVRLLARANSAHELRCGLAAFAAGRQSSIVCTAHVRPGTSVAFAFAGQSETRVGMGAELYAALPTFRATIDRCSAVARPLLGATLDAMISGEADPGLLDDARYAQPALFALQTGLAAVWRDWDVVPQAVTGHSLGEYAAACHAGAIQLEDAITLVVRRGSITHERVQPGMMAVVSCTEDELRPALLGRDERVALAAFNAPEVLVVSGPCADVADIVKAVRARGFSAKPLRISHAFHSECVDPMLDELERAAAEAPTVSPRIAFASALEGRVLAPGEVPDARYWRRHIREPVRFRQAVCALAERGLVQFLEIGPHTTLATLGARCVAGSHWVSSLKRSGADLPTIAEAACALWLAGVDVNMSRMIVDLGWQWAGATAPASAVG